MFKENIKTFFLMFPQKENVIDISPPNNEPERGRIKNLLHFGHNKNTPFFLKKLDLTCSCHKAPVVLWFCIGFNFWLRIYLQHFFAINNVHETAIFYAYHSFFVEDLLYFNFHCNGRILFTLYSTKLILFQSRFYYAYVLCFLGGWSNYFFFLI